MGRWMAWDTAAAAAGITWDNPAMRDRHDLRETNSTSRDTGPYLRPKKTRKAPQDSPLTAKWSDSPDTSQ